MTPLHFEALHLEAWAELGKLLDELETFPRPWRRAATQGPRADGARLSELYRQSCEHLALAQARSYPLPMIERLESLTQRAHQAIYRRQDYGVDQLKRLILIDIPESVRAHRWYVLISALLFVLPMIMVAWATYQDSGFISHLVDSQTARSFEQMYSNDAPKLGKPRDAGDDWQMLGYYIQNNIGIGFRCFASGVPAGLGSIFFILHNGLQIGAIAGYLTAQGHAENFYAFVVTHSSFELTGIVLSGAAGLRLGHALLAPGRRTRLEAFKHNAKGAVVVMYGVIIMLVIAAFLEAFWSSSRWISPPIKYAAGAVCWMLVISYLVWQGRPATVEQKVPHAS